ncbi:restriction endonuclease subunit S [Aliidiomarina halalkaliphila]|uniref:Restriction endonuclease subunit S n=1 Tax=Aliidiomarina halalkaliphila TaxID=2593535 RepID=A0A552WZF0_9GAMM|nr:restriction endonuclease subunit S [Aliidiomarina halalkaliphila]TRW48066.1 restriction endonuclease subunit S [Aliidiomarina halalkaliphila]
MSEVTINSVCETIFTGIPSNLIQKAEPADATHHMITGSSLNHAGELVEEALQPVQLKDEKSASKFLLTEGDVVVLTRGNSFRAAIVDSKTVKLKLIPSANLVVLRPNASKAKPTALVTHLNSALGQSQMEQLATGTTIKNVPASKLKELQFKLPGLETQEQIDSLFFASNQAYTAGIAMVEQERKVAMAKVNELMQGGA